MAKTALGAIGTAALVVLIFGPSVSSQRDRTFTGEIYDGGCAEMGGHMMMLQDRETAKDCTLLCVKLGSKYVLSSPQEKMVYQLDDQKKPESFAGARVRITGTLDKDNRTIHVSEIKPAS